MLKDRLKKTHPARGAMSVECPHCGARRGERCGAKGRYLKQVHDERLAYYRQLKKAKAG